MNSIRLLVPVCLASIVALSACTPKEKDNMSRNWTWKAATIDLTPIGQPGPPSNPGNVTLPGNQGCTSGSGAKLGCVKFANQDTGTLEFKLAGSPSVQTCEDAGVQRVITKIEFTDRPISAGSEKGNFYATPSTPLPAVIKNEAITVLDRDTGAAYSKLASEGETRVTLININGPGNPGASGKELWWRVTVSRCSDGLIWMADPRLVNEGME